MLLQVKVKPGSKRPRLETAPGAVLTAYLHSPPVEGRANDELVARLAEHFQVPKARIRIKSGLVSRTKLVEIL